MKKLLLSTIFVLFCSMAVEAQVREIRLPEKPKRAQHHDYSQDDAGFWCAVEASGGSSVITGHKNIQYADLTFTAGYRMNEYLRFGAGLGVRDYVAGNDAVRGGKEPLTLPVFVNARGSIITQYDRGIVPYWSVNVGAFVGDGVFFSPTIGMRIGQIRNSFLIGLNYTFGNIDVVKPIYSEGVNFFGLKIGYEF